VGELQISPLRSPLDFLSIAMLIDGRDGKGKGSFYLFMGFRNPSKGA
jgi:hypothetical protein